ncbi:TBC domain-containing protein kinase-like protein [Gigantopelta aegis]|uniref:TBC domain-containing protein kinase-like protein n=1 Tax=Gigantopelta aegis TaxID=1735272 RepID=UPI001B88AE23|nr:TBC domain-containing protein kinase-like protein [Gigantopelta aegis]
MSILGKAEFGVTTFFAASHPNDKCGANGLPLTPNSIKVFGQFQVLKTLEHPRICRYQDIAKIKHERLIVVAEYYKKNLENIYRQGTFANEPALLDLAFQIIQGLEYIHKKGITHRNLSPRNILFDAEGGVKLAEYGLYYMTNGGTSVSFPIGDPRFMPPEVFCQGPTEVHADDGLQPDTTINSGPKADSWMLGIILMQAFTKKRFWSDLSLKGCLEKLFSLLNSDMHPLDYLAKDQNIEQQIHELSKDALDFLRMCLFVSPSRRLSAMELKKHPVFKQHRSSELPHKNGFTLFSSRLRCLDLELPVYDEEAMAADWDDDHLSQRSMDEVYYLWHLAGGHLETYLKKAELIKTQPPINLLPCLAIPEGDMFGQVRDTAELMDMTCIVLSQEQLRDRLKSIEDTAYYPLLEDESNVNYGASLPTSPSSGDLTETASLPLVIKEKDIEYQFHRIILYERLLKAYPYKCTYIWKEARLDIPPLVRPYVWAALLEIEGDIEGRYDSIDKETPNSTDRQIEVDIPRCHQYHELLSSPTAHNKFHRILKAWVVSHPEYVYWQGLDSLCAPFLALNFNNEALAFSCLSAFIPKYLHKFFLKDNSAVIQEYLAVFAHLITFHDPELSNHLDGIGFIPDLYAIPWFLTMYAHVFPLHKIVHLWDTLLLGNSSFPLCIGVAILQQLRDNLLSFGFNECILLFSDMPEIDIGRCVQDSIKIFCGSPKSATFRQHARPPRKPKSEMRPNLSYYSRDYHEQPCTELSMEAVPVEELKVEKSPRISAEDLIELGELQGTALSRSPTKKKHNSKPMILVIDVRSQDEYQRGTIPGSINIPFQTAFSPEGELVRSPAVDLLNARKGQVKVIIGNRGRNAANFANELIRLGYPRVCVLHKGIDVLRPTGLLTVPPADL